MRFFIPAYLWVDVPSAAHADAAKQVVERLLTTDPTTSTLINGMLASNGIQGQGITVGAPKPAPPERR